MPVNSPSQLATLTYNLLLFSSQCEAMPSVHTQVSISDGAKLSVWVFGGDAPEKPLLIAVHGAPGLSSHIEPEQGYSFLSDRFRVLVFDLRGSGSSDLKAPFTDERWVEDIDELR